jgi:hypothetical protein
MFDAKTGPADRAALRFAWYLQHVRRIDRASSNQARETRVTVENDPRSVIAGRDPQLQRAVEELVKKMEAEPMRLPERPPDPVKVK